VFLQLKEISFAADIGVWPVKLASFGFAPHANKNCTKPQLSASTAWNRAVRPLLASFNITALITSNAPTAKGDRTRIKTQLNNQ
jgi:hypothetical protein